MWPGAWVQGAGRESPRRARYFSLLRQRKVPKRKTTPSLRPLRCAKGQTCGRAVAGCAVELALRSRAPLRHPRRVRARSMGATTPMPPRNRPAAGAASRGWTAEHPTAEQPHGPSLRSAQLSQRVALAPARRGRAQRSEAMARVDVRFWVPFCACREAQGRGCVRVPKDTRTSCTDLPQLFERSA